MINLCSVIFKGLHRPSGILFGVSICVLCMQINANCSWCCRIFKVLFVLFLGTHSVNERQYKGMPTHGIGRWKYLLPKQAPRKKKDKHQMKRIMSATDTAYGTLNVNVSGYDMTVVEHYSQYIHNFCNRLGIKVADSYALPRKSTEVMLMQEQGTKTYVDAVLKTHHRVIQVRPGLLCFLGFCLCSNCRCSFCRF
uniref:Mitochondrial ribosomal protein L48 n=1 Tax=Neolamprologus brichardi TaxID=32507 RepID=A0A3Q4MMW5_NEOBR